MIQSFSPTARTAPPSALRAQPETPPARHWLWSVAAMLLLLSTGIDLVPLAEQRANVDAPPKPAGGRPVDAAIDPWHTADLSRIAEREIADGGS